MRHSLAALALLLQACDPKVPPANPGARPSATSLPPPGILRLLKSGRTAAEILSDKKPAESLPSIVFRMEYAGPKTRLEVRHEAWHKGKPLASENGSYTLSLPVSDDVALGFTGFKSDEKSEVSLHESWPVRSKTPGDGNWSRRSSTLKHGVPWLHGRTIDTYRPAFPVDIPDGQEVVFWAVFVEEPPDAPAGSSLEERAKRADTAWIFRIRTADAKK